MLETAPPKIEPYLIELGTGHTAHAELQTSWEAFRDFYQRLRFLGEGDEAFIQTMNFSTRGHWTGLLVNGLEQATQRGATIHVRPDAHSTRLVDDRYDTHKLSKMAQPTEHDVFEIQQVHGFYHDLERMAQKGIELDISRPYWQRFQPNFFGRSHIKLWGMSENGHDSAWMGGTNMFDQALTEYTDLMIKFSNSSVTEALRDVFFEKPGIINKTIPVTQDYELLYDTGAIPGNSLIYRRGMDLITNPTLSELMFTSQFPNDPVINRLLGKAAARGVKIRELYSELNPFMTQGAGKKLYQDSLHMASRHGDTFELNHHYRYLHAKILIGVMDDGRTEVHTGSHNMSLAGVLFATRELQLISHDQELNAQVTAFFNDAFTNSHRASY